MHIEISAFIGRLMRTYVLVLPELLSLDLSP